MNFFFLWFFPLFLGFSEFVYSQKSDLNLSTIHLPVVYSQLELERSLNRYYLKEENGIFCNDDSFTNYDNDHLKSVCYQKDRIQVTVESNTVLTKVPIQIDAVYLVEEEFTLDLIFYEKTFNISFEKEISFNIFVTFETKVKIDKKLNLLPYTTWSFEWLSYPSIDFGIFSFRIDDVAEKAISRTLDEYAKNRIDQTLIEKIKIKDVMNAARELTSSPVLLNSQLDLWALFDMEDIRSGQVDLNQGKMQFYFESDFYGYLGFGFEELSSYMEELNSFPLKAPVSSQEKTNSFFVNFVMNINAVKLEQLIFDVLATRSVRVGSGDLLMEINEIYIKKIKNFVEAQIYLKNVDPNSAVKRYQLFLKFRPYYEPKERKIKMRNVSYRLETDSHLVNLGSILFQNTFQKAFEQNLSISMDDFLGSIQTNLNKDLVRKEIDPQKILKMKIDSIVIDDLRTTSTSLLVFFTATGTSELELVRMF